MIAPEERVKILQAETERLEEYLRNLPEEAWSHPSACEQWTVADVVAHLAGLSGDYPTWIDRALRGDSSPPEGYPAGGTEDQGSRTERTAHRATAFTERLGEQLLPTFIKANRELEEVLSRVGPEQWDELCYRIVGAEPIRNIVDMFIAERTVHGWDIRSRFDPKARVSPECLPVVVTRIPQRPRWWQFRTDPERFDSPIRYRFEVTDLRPYGADIVITEEKQYMEADGDAPADVTFRCDSETFVLLMYGRLKPDSAIADGQLSFEGDSKIAEEFEKRFVGG